MSGTATMISATGFGRNFSPSGPPDVCADRQGVPAATAAAAFALALGHRTAFRPLARASTTAEAEDDQRRRDDFLPADRGALAERQLRAPGRQGRRQILEWIRHQLIASTAAWIAARVASGRDTIDTWDASTSVIVAPARSAMRRCVAIGMTRSWVPSTAQLGIVFHAGAADGVTLATKEAGRCVATIVHRSASGRS